MNRLRQFLVGQATLVDWDYNIQKESFAQLRKSDNRGGGPGLISEVRGWSSDIKPETFTGTTLNTGVTTNMCSGHLSEMIVLWHGCIRGWLNIEVTILV